MGISKHSADVKFEFSICDVVIKTKLGGKKREHPEVDDVKVTIVMLRNN